MGTPFATPDDVAARWRPLTSAEEGMAAALLTDASAMIRAEYPGIDGQVTSGAVDPDVLVAVVAGMVKTAMIGGVNGDGARSVAQGAGPFTVSTTYVNPTGALYLTPVMDRMIRGYKPAAASHTFANTTNRCENSGPGFVYGPL